MLGGEVEGIRRKLMDVNPNMELWWNSDWWELNFKLEKMVHNVRSQYAG